MTAELTRALGGRTSSKPSRSSSLCGLSALGACSGSSASSRPSRSSSSCGLESLGGGGGGKAGVLRLGRPGSSSGTKRAGSCGMGRAAKVFQKQHQVATAENGVKVLLVPGQILLPAAGAANDMLRMRNAGARRGSVDEQDEPVSPISLKGFDPPKAPQGLPPALSNLSRAGSSASRAPFEADMTPKRTSEIRSAESESGASRSSQPLRESGACWGCGSRPQSPRMLSGKLRKSSLVEISYPGGPWGLKLSSLPSSPAGSAAVSRTPSSRMGPLPSDREGRPKIWWPPEIEEEVHAGRLDSEQFEREQALKKSMRIMESLYSIRRAGWRSEDLPQEGPELDSYLAEQQSKDQLMLQVLRDTDDDEATLAQVEEVLSEFAGDLQTLGGSRHATSVLAGRALAVVRRKRGHLQALEDSMRAFDEAQAQGAEILQKLKQDPGYSAPAALSGMDKALRSVIHRGAVEPVDENKVDFRLFSQTFGLSAKHQAFKQIKEKAQKAMSWWAETALKEARAGTDPAVLKRILAVSSSILHSGGGEDNEDIVETKRLLGNALAESCLRTAEAVRDKDQRLVEASGKPEPESANTAYRFIDNDITMAVSMGARPGHPSMELAKQIVTQLQQDEKDRLARRVFEYARGLKETDEINALTAKDAMKVGPALWAADSIKKEVQKARGLGVPENHTSLVEARRLEQQLRDEDLGRRRTAGQGEEGRRMMKSSSKTRLYKNVRALCVIRSKPADVDADEL